MFLKGGDVGASQVVHGGPCCGVGIGHRALCGVMEHFGKVVDPWGERRLFWGGLSNQSLFFVGSGYF